MLLMKAFHRSTEKKKFFVSLIAYNVMSTIDAKTPQRKADIFLLFMKYFVTINFV